MNLLDFGVYAGIIGGAFYLILLVLFRNRFSGCNRISWVLLLEMAIFTVLTGFSTWGARNGYIPFYVSGVVGWTWLGVVIITILTGLKTNKPWKHMT